MTTAKKSKTIEPPRHLSPAMRKWWRSVIRAYRPEPHQLHLLQLAAEAWDDARAARKAVAKHGATVIDRFGQLKVHPQVAIEQNARRDFAALVKQLGFPDPDPED